MHASVPTSALNAPCLAPVTSLLRSESDGGWLLTVPEASLQLNRSAAEILQRCDGTRSVDTIVAELETLFAVHGIEREVRSFLDEARERGWLVDLRPR